MASSNGHADVVELLLSKGANIHKKDRDGDSSIILASSNGHADAVELLLSKGANIHDKDNQGNSSLMRALDLSSLFGTDSTKTRAYTDVYIQRHSH